MDNSKNNGVEERILNAALKVMNKETISGTRMHLIAAQAEMGQSNVHYYYKTKDELMLSLQEKVLQKCYEIRTQVVKKSVDTLESQLHVFFLQKKNLINKKKEFDFAEMNFIVEGKVNKEIHDRFVDSYDQWREDIRAVLVKYCPKLNQSDTEMIPYMVVSLLQGASVQSMVDFQDFEMDAYFENCERMVLDYIGLLQQKNNT